MTNLPGGSRGKHPTTCQEVLIKEAEAKHRELIKMFEDTAKLFQWFCQNGITHLFGQEDGLIRVSKEQEAEMMRLFTLYKKKGLL